MKKSHLLPGFDAHHRLIVGLVCAALAFVLVGKIPWAARSLAAWDALSGAILLLCWMRLLAADAKTSVREAKLQDSNRAAIFLFVNFGALASLLAVGLLLSTADKSGGSAQTANIFLAGGTIVLSWLLIHTVFSLHYAHMYYRSSGRSAANKNGGGLQFPGDEAPEFLDFAYFSFVVGMTCQVSDVQISSRPLRQMALLHGLLSFIFNTVILAWSINLLAGMIK